jgi:hypothetical protein
MLRPLSDDACAPTHGHLPVPAPGLHRCTRGLCQDVVDLRRPAVIALSSPALGLCAARCPVSPDHRSPPRLCLRVHPSSAPDRPVSNNENL